MELVMKFFRIRNLTNYTRCVVQTSRQNQSCVVAIILTMALMVPQVGSSPCRRRFTAQTIQYRDCLPKRILTYACAGSCVTSAHISSSNPLTLERSCFQCREAVVNTRRIKVTCPNNDIDSSEPFKKVTINITVPRDCQCEPCSFDDVIGVPISNQ